MVFEHVDVKRSAWDAETLARILARLHDNGYQGLVSDLHQVVSRYARPHADRSLKVALAEVDGFADVLIPPAQPHARVILLRLQPDVLRVVVAGRSQQEIRRAATALRMHLEAAVGSRLQEMVAEDGVRASLERFRNDVLPALKLSPNGGSPVGVRDPSAASLLAALRRQPVFRGMPTVFGSQVATLAPDRAAERIKETLEHLTEVGAVERWHVVVCRQGGQWLAVAPGVEEIKTFLSSNVTCPHCGTRVNEEQQDVAYRLAQAGDAYLADNRWVCDLVETTLRRAGVEAVAVHPGAGPVSGAACYYGAVILFRAKDGAINAGDAADLRERARQLEQNGWPVFPVLVCDQPAPADARGADVLIVDNLSTLGGVLESILQKVREKHLSALLPSVLRPIAVAAGDLLPADGREA